MINGSDLAADGRPPHICAACYRTQRGNSQYVCQLHGFQVGWQDGGWYKDAPPPQRRGRPPHLSTLTCVLGKPAPEQAVRVERLPIPACERCAGHTERPDLAAAPAGNDPAAGRGFLTAKQLQQLTGCAKVSEQISWLNARALRYHLRRDGKPVLSWLALQMPRAGP